MADLTFQNPTPAMLMSMADGLMLGGKAGDAAKIYQIALKTARGAERQRLQVRLGLATSSSRQRLQLLKVLLGIEEFGGPAFVGDGLVTWGKSMPFLDDERFAALAQKHANLLPIANWHWNLQAAIWAMRQARAAEGDFVELGVFKGHTTIFAAEYLEFETWPRRWFLYDTFDGIPDDQLDPGWAEMNQKAYGDTFSYEEVRDRFAAFSNIEVFKGRVPEVLDGTCPERIAFVHLDLNNSTAEIQALDALYDRISPGGVILLDDFGWATARAQYEAESAWFAARGLQVLALPTGQGVFVKVA